MKNAIKTSLMVFPLLLVLVLGFNNCSRYGQLSDEGGADGSSRTPLGPTPNHEETNSEKLGIPIALLSAEQTLSSMMAVTNLTSATTALMNEYNTRYGALAPGNDLSLVNGPLMLSSTSLAGEVCNGLLTQEKSLAVGDRNFFSDINFATGVMAVSEAAFDKVVRAMARSFWGRLETEEELSLLQSYRSEFTQALSANARSQASSSSNLMLGLCSAMLSSFDAISY